MIESLIPLPEDGAGRKLHAYQGTRNGNTVETQAFLFATEEKRFEWQSSGGENKPLYIGSAEPGTLTSASIWRIEKYTFSAGPAGGQVPTRIQTAIGAWDDRATLF